MSKFFRSRLPVLIEGHMEHSRRTGEIVLRAEKIRLV